MYERGFLTVFKSMKEKCLKWKFGSKGVYIKIPESCKKIREDSEGYMSFLLLLLVQRHPNSQPNLASWISGSTGCPCSCSDDDDIDKHDPSAPSWHPCFTVEIKC
jgi:hypothetical protein